MLSAKFDPQRFFQDRDNVALRVAAGEVFSLLKRTLDLPASWAALVRLTSGAIEVVRAGRAIESRDADDVMFVRVTPIDVSLTVDDLTSKEGYACRAEVGLRLRLVVERGDLVAFQESVLGSRRVVQCKRLVEHLTATVREGLSNFAAGQDAAVLMDARGAGPAATTITQAIEALCFASGLVLDAAPTVRFDSDSFRRVHQAEQRATVRRAEHEAARQVDDALHKARAEHLEQLGSTLTRLRELAAQSPQTPLPDLIRTFSEKQRGELYEALFASEKPASRTKWIVVVAAEELLFFDPADLTAPARRFRIDGPAGQARSVRQATLDGTKVLLVGASTGVYIWPIDASTPSETLLVPGAPRVRGGFNAAAVVEDRIVATHSELGIGQWPVGCVLGTHPGAVRPKDVPYKSLFPTMTQSAKAVRDVEAFGDRLYCSIDDRIIAWSGGSESAQPANIFTGSRTSITALCPTDAGLYAGNSDGDVLCWSTGNDTEPELIHRGARRAAESIWVVESHGVRRLLFTDTSPQVHAKVLGDSFVCHYEAGGQTLRRVEVTDDLIAATNDLRDRLILWSPARPNRPSAILPIGAMTGRSVQDVALIAAPPASGNV